MTGNLRMEGATGIVSRSQAAKDFPQGMSLDEINEEICEVRYDDEDAVERKLNEADCAAEQDGNRYTGEEVFGRLRKRSHASRAD